MLNLRFSRKKKSDEERKIRTQSVDCEDTSLNFHITNEI